MGYTGVKSFELYKRVGGRPTRLKIGRFPGVTVEQARKQVVRMTGEIAQGMDPHAERRRARAEASFKELFERFMEVHARPHLRTASELENMHRRYLTPLDHRKVSSIDMADVQRLHSRIGKEAGHYAANRALALMSSVYSTCAAGTPNPCKGVRHFKEQSRERFLPADELKRLLAALDDEPDDTWRHFFTLLLLTGARRSNVEGMRWADVSLERGLWAIPGEQSKNAQQLAVVLVPAAVEILRARQGNNGEWVFPSKRGDGHIIEPKAAWKAILKRAKITDCRMHDLRRTLGSWQAAAGVSMLVIGKSLGHRSQASTAVYARMNMEPVRAAVTAATDSMLKLLPGAAPAANGEPAQKVLPAPNPKAHDRENEGSAK